MEESKQQDIEKTISTVCNSHCGGCCPLTVHVQGGKITRITTDDEFRACVKGRAWRQRVYAPDRLQYPLKRIGERGKGEFVQISWDEALDTVASEIKRVRETYGPPAILLYYSNGEMSQLQNASLIENLLARTGGNSGTWGCFSNEGAQLASAMTYGTSSCSNTRDDMLNSRMIILWGWNPVVTNYRGNTAYYLAQASDAGIRIVAVDPRYHDSAAAFAEEWIPIRPQTDTAMLLAMAYVIITENLHDQKFLDQFTVGFDKFKEYVLGVEDGTTKTPSWAAEITGVSVETISRISREYATQKPSALFDGYGPGRTAYGEQFHRTAITLAAMTGNIGVRGGSSPGEAVSGVYMPFFGFGPKVGERMKDWINPVDQAMPNRKNALFYNKLNRAAFYRGGPSSARVNRISIADAILGGKDAGYPADYKLLYVVNCNYINQSANSNKIAEALRKLEFVVVHEQFMTPIAKFADMVLPTNTFLERNDLCVGGVGLFYGYMNKTIESVGGSKSHFEIATELAAKMGVPDFAERTEEEWIRKLVEERKDIPSYDAFKKKGFQKIKAPSEPYVCFEKQIKDPINNPFPTPSGKIEIYSQELADLANPFLPSIPKYIEAWEGPHDPLATKYPLQLVTTHTRRRAHTQFDNLPWLRELYPQAISINSSDAELRGIKDGDMVRVFNDRGAMIIPALVTERIMPGVVDIPQGAWYDPDENGIDRGGCANVLTLDRIGPGAAFASNTALVQVEKA